MHPPVVLLDACTLYPAALRDVLMRLAVHELILARWTNAIHEEWMAAVVRNRPDLSPERLQRTRQLMDLHAEGSLVTGYEHHMAGLELPDPADRHVLAAAIEAKAEVILTWNLRDFPVAALVSHGIHAETPDALMCRLFQNHRDRLLMVLRQARLSLKLPPLSPSEYLGVLRCQGLSEACVFLEPFLSDL